MMGCKMSGTGSAEQSSCQARCCSGVSVSAEGERAAKSVTAKSFFLEGRWFGGIFRILLILSENAFRGWADGEAFTEARRHGRG